jgi:hypothetical protein
MAADSVRRVRAGTGIEGLPDSHWKQFRDVRRPDRPDTKVDHVLVGPSGIHVICYLAPESTADDVVVQSSAEAARAVGALLPERYRLRVRAMVCFRNEEPVAESVDGVTITSLLALEHILHALPVVLSTCEVSETGARLERRLEPFPLDPGTAPNGHRLRRRLVALAAAAAVVAGGVVLGPELVESIRVW